MKTKKPINMFCYLTSYGMLTWQKESMDHFVTPTLKWQRVPEQDKIIWAYEDE